jgi:hypothetical protein
MTVSLIGWGKLIDGTGKKLTVLAPNTDHGKPWLWDFFAAEAPNLAAIGFDRIQLPPASKAHGGNAAHCDGYSVFDAHDLGVKNQQGSIPTRYGSADSLRHLIAVAHSCGLSVDLDIVLHHLSGGQNGTYLGGIKARYKLDTLDLVVDSKQSDSETLHFTALASEKQVGQTQQVKLAKGPGTPVLENSWVLTNLAERGFPSSRSPPPRLSGNERLGRSRL